MAAGISQRRHSLVLEAAFRLASDPGGVPPTTAGVAKASGVGARSILYWYGDGETLYRLAVARQAAALTAPLAEAPPPGAALRAAILDYARRCADLFASDAYRRLAFLLMRDGPSRPWLVARHRQSVIEPVEAGLARVVRLTGGTAEIRSSGTRAFVARLQRELALPMLLPGEKGPTARELAEIAETAAGLAMKAVYETGTVAAALGHLVRQRLPASPLRDLEAAA
jgi:AcrR family transcriptional regulator